MSSNGRVHVLEGEPVRSGSFGGEVLAEPPAAVSVKPRSLEEARFFQHLGPLKAYLDDERTTNIHVNANDTIFVEQTGRPKFKAPESMSEAQRASLIMYIANLQYGRAMDYLHSRLQTDLPVYGSRVQAFAPPIVKGWAMILRQHAKTPFTLDHYRKHGQVQLGRKRGVARKRPTSLDAIDAIEEAIATGANVALVGSTNAGKTALLNACIDAKAKVHGDYRVVVVQDRAELRAEGFEDRIEIMARVEQAHHESNGVVTRYTYDFSDALEDALRSNIDCLIWGEVRDALSQFGLLMARNTGTDGLMTTFHAENLNEVFSRISDLLQLGGKTAVPGTIAKLFDLYAFMDRDPDTGDRWLGDLQWLEGLDADGKFLMTPLGTRE